MNSCTYSHLVISPHLYSWFRTCVNISFLQYITVIRTFHSINIIITVRWVLCYFTIWSFIYIINISITIMLYVSLHFCKDVPWQIPKHFFQKKKQIIFIRFSMIFSKIAVFILSLIKWTQLHRQKIHFRITSM